MSLRYIILFSFIFSSVLGVNLFAGSNVYPSGEKKELQVNLPADIQSDLNSPDPVMRRVAINKLASTRKKEFIPVIEKYLYDSEKIVKITAIESLGLLRSTKSVGKIIDILSKTDDKDIKNSCLIALSYMPQIEPEYVDKIIKYTFAERDENLKAGAIRLLGNFKIKNVEDKLIKIVLDEKNSSILRESALKALVDIRSEKIISELKKLIMDNDKRVKIMAVRAAGELGVKSLTEDLRARVGEKDPDIQLEASLSLAKMGDNFPLSAMYKYLDDSNLNYKQMALNIISIIGDNSSISILDKKIDKEENQNIKEFMKFVREKIKARLKLSAKDKK